MSVQKLIASFCYIVCVLPTLNKTYLFIYLFIYLFKTYLEQTGHLEMTIPSQVHDST